MKEGKQQMNICAAALLVAMPISLAASPVRVLTYNIRYSAGDVDSADNNWPARREALAQLVENERPEVVGFQEVLPDQLTWLRGRFPAYEFIGVGRNANGDGEASPVAFLKERFSVVTNGTFWLSTTPDTPGSKSWGAAFPRVCTYAVLKDKGTGEKLQELTVSHIEDIHLLLTKELAVDRGIRRRRVGITGTNYHPLDNEFQIREAMRDTCSLINGKENIFDKALLTLVLISYIQPFSDGNKRTARITSNAILIANGYCPLSFRSVDSIDYKKALLIFYEQNNLYAFKQIFMDQFEFAVREYF